MIFFILCLSFELHLSDHLEYVICLGLVIRKRTEIDIFIKVLTCRENI